MELLKCLELHAKMRSYFTIFILHVHIFIKITADSWSPLKTDPKDISLVYVWRKKNFSKKIMGYTPDKKLKKKFWTQISRFIYQSTQFSTEITNLILFLLKNVIGKTKIAGYEPVWGWKCHKFYNIGSIKELLGALFRAYVIFWWIVVYTDLK
jgi:hypothetical protein